LMARAIIDGGGLELAAANLVRLDESVEEEMKAMDDALTLVENLLDIDLAGALPTGEDAGKKKKKKKTATEAILRDTALLAWLLNRISAKESSDGKGSGGAVPSTLSFPAMKLRASEILSSILQRDESRLFARDISKLDVPTSAALDELQSKPSSADDGESSAKDDRVDGMECLLQSVASYRKRDPQSAEECEYLENCLDALSAALLSRNNARAFLEAEGVELMVRCLRERVHGGGGALKCLSFALSGSSSASSKSAAAAASGANENKDQKEDDDEDDDRDKDDDPYIRACETFVDAGGLKYLFPSYMGKISAVPKPAKVSDAGRPLPSATPPAGGASLSETEKTHKLAHRRTKKIKSARRAWLRSLEGDALRILYSLTVHLTPQSPHASHERLVSKFLERDFEKIDRAVELLLKYDSRARRAEYGYHRSERAEMDEERDDAEEDFADMAAAAAKLRGGGELCHRAAAVLGFACNGSKRCHGHVLGQLRAKNAGVGVIKSALREFSSLLEDGPQKDTLLSYLDAI